MQHRIYKLDGIYTQNVEIGVSIGNNRDRI